MKKDMLNYYWDTIPTSKDKAISYAALSALWNMNRRSVRQTLHKLSEFDSGDNYILIRSGRNKGFYKTDDIDIIERYRRECVNKARSNFAPLKKIDKVLSHERESMQVDFANNLRLQRTAHGMKQQDVVEALKPFDCGVDISLLSKFENSVCIPSPYQLYLLSRIYHCEPSDLLDYNLVMGIV